MIYTSYFANIKNIPPDLFKVSIARYSDKFPDIPKYDKLIPESKLLYQVKNNIINKYVFIKKFNGYLLTLDPEEILAELNKMSGGRDVCLLCYEVPTEFCHRQLIAKWFEDNFIRCQEYGEPELTRQEWLYKLGITDKELIDKICFDCD